MRCYKRRSLKILSLIEKKKYCRTFFGDTLPLFIKPEKLIQISFFDFCVGEPHKKLSCV